MGNSEIFFHGNTTASKKNYLSILIMESFNLQNYHQNEFEQKVEEDNLKMLASIASFYPQLSINSNGYANYFTEKNIQNEMMGFQQQNYIDPAMFYYNYYHNSEHCYHYYLEKNIFPQIQEFLGSQQYIGGEDSKQSYDCYDDTSLYCPDLKNNVKQEIISMEEVQEDSGNDDATISPQIQEVFGGEDAQLLIEGTEELLCKHCYYPGHETFQCPSLYKLALKEIENYESYNSTDEQSSKMPMSGGDVSEFKNEIPSDIKCPHMPLKKRGKLSCVSCFLLTV